MKRRRLVILFIGLLILTPMFFAFFMERVPPDQIGVKQIRWGGGGFVEQDFSTGYHIGITGYHLWHYLPRETHFVHFTKRSVSREGVVEYQPPLEIRTKDNNKVDVELSIPFRIRDGEAHAILADSMRVDYFDRAVATMNSAIRSGLAALSSEDMQDPDKRIARATALLPQLNEQLALYHVEAESILIRRFDFPPEYEEQLQEKQYLRQKANLDTALTAQSNEEKAVFTIERQIVAAEKALTQDWEKRLQEQRSDYEVQIAGIRAEGDIYASRTRAEGEAQRVILEAEGRLAIERAEALRNELRTEALNSEGGSILLALDAADNLQVPRVTLNSDDPAVPMLLDLSAMTRLLVGDLAD